MERRRILCEGNGLNKSLEPSRRSIDQSRALGVGRTRNASSSESMIFWSCDLRDEKVWQKAGASSRTANIQRHLEPITAESKAVKCRVGGLAFLFVKAKVCEVIVLHNILFSFEALVAGPLGLSFATGSNEISEADDLGADEPLLHVRVDSSSRFPGRCALANRPGAIFFSANRQKANVAGIRESLQEERVGILEVVAVGHSNGFVR